MLNRPFHGQQESAEDEAEAEDEDDDEFQASLWSAKLVHHIGYEEMH